MRDMRSYADMVADGSELSRVAAEALQGKRLICNRRQVPPFWLVHGGRLLPSLIWDAAKRQGKAQAILEDLRAPERGSYAYLPRVYIGDVSSFSEGCAATIRELVDGQEIIRGANGPLVNVRTDRLIRQFFEDVVSQGSSIDDRFYWALFRTYGGIPVGAFDPIAYDWREYYGLRDKEIARSSAAT